MPVELEHCLQGEKIARGDAISYVGNQLVRQRLVNEAVVKFAERYIPANSAVIDACAGPEGSYLAAVRRGHRWVGNDISQRFSEVLSRLGADVTLSDFSSAPFKDSSADATLFILALDNICSPVTALSEARRVTKPGGVIVEAEPGLSSWTGKIILHSLLSQDSSLQSQDYISNRDYPEKIEDQFRNKPYSEAEYIELLLKNTLGQNRETVLAELRLIISSSPKAKVFFRFQQYIIKQYFRNLDNIRQALGLKVEKAGILVMGLTDQQEWIVPDPIEVQPENWIQEVVQARKWKVKESYTVEQFPRILDGASKRIIMPVLCLR